MKMVNNNFFCFVFFSFLSSYFLPSVEMNDMELDEQQVKERKENAEQNAHGKFVEIKKWVELSLRILF